MKNYKKIYRRLLKEIKEEVALVNTALVNKEDSVSALAERIEYKGMLTSLNWLMQLSEELEGKKHHNMVFHKKEFKEWKKELTV